MFKDSIFPAKEEFLKLSKKGNLIPIYREISADLETPVSSYLKISNARYSFLLESVEGQERIARYSFLGSNPSLIFESKANLINLYKDNSTKETFRSNNPISELKKIFNRYKFVKVSGIPSFCGGLIGYFGYDMVRFIEDIHDKNIDDLNIADCIFILADNLIIFDHINHSIKIVSNVFLEPDLSRGEILKKYNEAIKKISSVERELTRSLSIKNKLTKVKKDKVSFRDVQSNFKKNEFTKIVKKAKEYIKKGDIIQVVLSQRFKVKLTQEPFSVYRNLRSINPSPYMFYLKFNKVVLMGSSPELLVRCENNIVETRPIAGTRPRGRQEQDDKRLEQELLRDKKERAEHIMLVDLGRNDLGRVCVPTSIKTDDFMTIERYSHVMHIVTDVNGRLRKDKDLFDCIASCFPAGTVTGAPKVRAMQIIEELENSRRSAYAGAVGYFSFSGNLDTCITIRSILIKNGSAYIQAGAGIVADSKPEKEYRETVNKAKAQISAVLG